MNARPGRRAGVVDVAVVGDVLGQPQLDLVGGRRQGLRAVVGVDDEQVHGVGADVDDPEAHGPHVVRRVHGSAADLGTETGSAVPETPLDTARIWVEFADPADSEPALPLRPDLADVELDVHLRQRVPGHLRRPAGRRLLHPRRALHRQGRRQAGQAAVRRARRGRVAAPPAAAQARSRRGPRRRTTRARPRWSTAPASSSTGPASRPAPAAPCTSTRCSPARRRTASSRTSAGSCRSGAPTAASSCPTAPRTSR